MKKVIDLYFGSNTSRSSLHLYFDKKIIKGKMDFISVALPFILSLIGLIALPTYIIMFGNYIWFNLFLWAICIFVIYWMVSVVRRNNKKKDNDKKWEELFSH